MTQPYKLRINHINSVDTYKMNTTRCYQRKINELLESRLLKIEDDVEGKLYGNSGMGIRTLCTVARHRVHSRLIFNVLLLFFSRYTLLK